MPRIDLGVAARLACPRGAVDLALAYHARGDAEMLRRLALEDLPTLRLRDRIAMAIRIRIEAIDDREAVRRGSRALLAAALYAADGAQAIWGTVDQDLGPRSAIQCRRHQLVYQARLAGRGLFGDIALLAGRRERGAMPAAGSSFEARVDDALNLERVRAQITGNPVMKLIFAGPNWLAGQGPRTAQGAQEGFPGSWTGDEDDATG